MPRIPQTELDALKSGVDLPTLIRAKGIELKPHGSADLIGRCPFHDDKTPSLVVTPVKGLWHCLGACQTGGDVLNWVMKAEGVSFRHAVELLRDGKASTLLSSDKLVKMATVPKLPPPVSVEADDQTLLNQVVDYYHKTLLEDPLGHAAREYLKKRGLFHPEAVATFKLGYANRTLGLHLPHKSREAGAQIRAHLEKLGVFRESSGHEHLAGSLIVPILDAHGNAQGLYGRKVNDMLRSGTPKHLYLPGPHRGVFNPAALHQKEIILCEALIDALSFWVHGFRNVTSSFGVEGFTEDMLSAFIKNGVRRVYIAYDRDEAGDKAAERLAGKLLSEGIECLRVLFPHGMDANEYIRKMSPADNALRVLLNGATWLGKGQKPAISLTALPSGEHVDTETGEVLPAAAAGEPPSLVASAVSADPAPTVEPAPPAVEPQGSAGSALPYTLQGEDVHITLGDRLYRVRGLHKNLSYEVLKVNLRASVGERYYLDTLDFYHAKHREAFVNHAALDLEYKADVLKRDLGRILLLLEELQDKKIQETLEPKADAAYTMSPGEEAQALALLKSPDLLARILKDFEALGVVGEELGKLTGYLAATSRKLDDPLGVIIQSSSSAGKSSLMEAILSLMPKEERVKYSAMTGQALFYMGETDLKHKILALVEGEGAERASYALKLLQSEKELCIASTGKDPQTGKLVTQTYRVEGPVMLFLTTTAVDIDPELLNRCLILSVDESREQTRAIHRLQREAMTLDGLLRKEARQKLLTLHQNAQRLLKPLRVVNPYAEALTFVDDKTRTRRDQVKYLTLIHAIALLHQYQRPVKRKAGVEYIEVELSDIETANRLAHPVLGRSLDELAPQTRRLLMLVHQMVTEACQARALAQADLWFSRKEIRAFTGLSDFQVRVHLARLVELEYVLPHRGQRGQSFVYELIYDGGGQDGKPYVPGLVDLDHLKAQFHAYDGKFEGVNGRFEGPTSPQSGAFEGGMRGAAAPLSGNSHKGESENDPEPSEKAYPGKKKSTSSYEVPNHKEAPSLVAASAAHVDL